MFSRQRPARGILFLCSLFLFFMCVGTGGFAQENSSPGETDSRYVSIDFNDVDINVFIKFISKLTNKNFVVDSRVKGNVTIISPSKISVKDAYKVFQTVLDINGFSTVESGRIIKIIPTPTAKADNLDTRIVTKAGGPESADDRIVTRIIPLEYAQSGDLKNLFTPLVPKGSVVLSYDDTNMLIVTATLSSIDRLLKIVGAIDQQSVGKTITVIPIQNADAGKLVKNLTAVFSATGKLIKGRNSSSMDVKFVSDERTNSIILLASKEQTDKVKTLVELLDQQVPKGEERIRVYYLEHATAEDMVKVLLEIPDNEKQKKTAGQKTAPLLSEHVKIMADKTTNSLIIMADKEDYPILEDVISKLDIPRSMVYIECLIMEVNVTSGLNIGTEWKAAQGFNNDSRVVTGGYGNTSDNSAFQNLTTLEAGSLPDGFSVGVLGKNFTVGGITFPDIQAVVQALQTDKDVNIIATPQVLTTENEEASIVIGKNVPFQTRSAAESGVETYNSFEYKDVGITLKITPQISKDRLVRLDVYQELTKLDSASQSSTDRPTTLKREIDTTIIVEDGNSVVIGGLIDETTTKSTNKMPCMGNVPVLGWAFKSVSEGKEKTNLYVFLTPKVIRNPLEMQDLLKEKRQNHESVKSGEVLLYDKLNRTDDKK